MSTNERSHDAPDRAHEAALALLAEGLTPTGLDPHERARLLAQLRGPERWAPWASDVAHHFGLAREDALDALRAIENREAWRAGPWPGSEILATPRLSAHHTVIARLPGGTRIASHEHASRELTYILEGRLVEDGSLEHGPGELLAMEKGTRHHVAVPAASACLVVFSVVPV